MARSRPGASRRPPGDREELGVQIAVGDLLARTPIRAGLVLHLYAGVLLAVSRPRCRTTTSCAGWAART